MKQLRKLRRQKARNALRADGPRIAGCRSDANGPDCHELRDEHGQQGPICFACEAHETALGDSPPYLLAILERGRG